VTPLLGGHWVRLPVLALSLVDAFTADRDPWLRLLNLTVLAGEPDYGLLRFPAKWFGVFEEAVLLAALHFQDESTHGRVRDRFEGVTDSFVRPAVDFAFQQDPDLAVQFGDQSRQLVAEAADEIDIAFQRSVEQRRPSLHFAVDRALRAFALEQNRFRTGLV